MNQFVEQAASLAFRNLERVRGAQRVGCYSCTNTFPARAVEEWTDAGQTALCPHCGIDAIVAETPEMPLTQELLGQMMERWMCGTAPLAEVEAAIDAAISAQPDQPPV